MGHGKNNGDTHMDGWTDRKTNLKEIQEKGGKREKKESKPIRKRGRGRGKKIEKTKQKTEREKYTQKN